MLWYMVRIVHAALCLYLLTSRICRAATSVRMSSLRRLREAGRQGWQDDNGVNVEPRYTEQAAVSNTVFMLVSNRRCSPDALACLPHIAQSPFE